MVRAPRPTTFFRRVALGGFASALIPRRWGRIDLNDSSQFTWVEEGFGPGWWYDGSEVLPAKINLETHELSAATDAHAVMQVRMARHATFAKLSELEPLSQCDLAFGALIDGSDKHLVAIATSGRRAAVLDWPALMKRYPDLFGLFRFVVASLRAGSRADAREKVVMEARELA